MVAAAINAELLPGRPRCHTWRQGVPADPERQAAAPAAAANDRLPCLPLCKCSAECKACKSLQGRRPAMASGWRKRCLSETPLWALKQMASALRHNLPDQCASRMKRLGYPGQCRQTYYSLRRTQHSRACVLPPEDVWGTRSIGYQFRIIYRPRSETGSGNDRLPKRAGFDFSLCQSGPASQPGRFGEPFICRHLDRHGLAPNWPLQTPAGASCYISSGLLPGAPCHSHHPHCLPALSRACWPAKQRSRPSRAHTSLRPSSLHAGVSVVLGCIWETCGHASQQAL